MLYLGLTGGMGSGKSTAAGIFRQLGAVVIDADQLAREVLAPGSPGLAAVVRTFGTQVAPAGQLHRARLAEVVFGHPERLAQLEEITHPRIAQRAAELRAKAAPDAIVIYDLPLLVEQQRAAEFHLVLAVHAPESVRLERLQRGRRISPAQARERLSHQVSEAQRRQVADIWLPNTAGPEVLYRHCEQLWESRLLPYAARLHSPAVAGDVNSDAQIDGVELAHWARRTRARLIHVLGSSGGAYSLSSGLTPPGEFRLWVRDPHWDGWQVTLAAAGFVPGSAAHSELGRCYTAADPACPARLSVLAPRVTP